MIITFVFLTSMILLKSSDDCRSGEREGGAWDQQRDYQRRRRHRRRGRRRRGPVRHDGHRGVDGRLHDGIRADGVPDAFQVLYVSTRGTGVEQQRVLRDELPTLRGSRDGPA